MPSIVCSAFLGSGPAQLISGNPFSGRRLTPQGGVQMRASASNSGIIFIWMSGGLAASGGPTINSGALFASGGSSSGMMDGTPLYPGDAAWIPVIGCATSSGYLSIFCASDAQSSGQSRLYFECF